MEPPSSPSQTCLSTQQRRYWRRAQWLTAGLLLLWFASVFVSGMLVESLRDWTLAGVPVAYYFFSQGTPIVFLVIIGLYVWTMNRLDRRFGVGERRAGNKK